MHTRDTEILRKLARPLEPIPTGQSASLRRLDGVRAVLFDVYGTLFVSDSGEVGADRRSACQQAFSAAAEAVGMPSDGIAGEGVRRFIDAIDDSHRRSSGQGVEHPEVDIVAVWRQVVAGLAAWGCVEGAGWSDDRLGRLAVEYEGRVNPVWPMPGVGRCLSTLAEKGLTLGIVSNAQFYTPLLFAALLGGSAESLGFDPELQFYSYRSGHAKPGLMLHRLAAEALGRRGIRPAEAVCVGNDVLNDIYPAAQLGFRTALFAGDARSLRLRQGEPRLDGLSPDLVLNDLAELLRCV